MVSTSVVHDGAVDLSVSLADGGQPASSAADVDVEDPDVWTAAAIATMTSTATLNTVPTIESTRPAVAIPAPPRRPWDDRIRRRAEADTMIPGTPARRPRQTSDKMPSTRPHTARGSVCGAA